MQIPDSPLFRDSAAGYPSLRRTALSQAMLEGRVVHRDVLEEVYSYINEKFGSNESVP